MEQSVVNKERRLLRVAFVVVVILVTFFLLRFTAEPVGEAVRKQAPSTPSRNPDLEPVRSRGEIGGGEGDVGQTVWDLSPVLDDLSRTLGTHEEEASPHGAWIELPMPDGGITSFEITETSVMEQQLAARYPSIKTYAGRGLDDPSASLRLDITPSGLHAQVLSSRGLYYIDPINPRENLYAVYARRDAVQSVNAFECLTASVAAPTTAAKPAAFEFGGTLRIFRLALAATGEYTAYHGGTVQGALAAMVTAVNRVNGIYETELGIRLVLVADNDQLIFTDPTTDPYDNYDGQAMLLQNQSTLDAVIGDANYDIGHVFSTGGGGLAQVGSVGQSGAKAQGVTGLASPVGDAFYVDYVAHEMGHQFGATHTFNSTVGSCGGNNREPSTAYEPGSGSTIMGYAGVCGVDSIQAHSDTYFHAASLEQIAAYITSGAGGAVGTQSSTGNHPPSVDAGWDHTIPANTPFRLAANAVDPDGDAVLYCWEEFDLGPASNLGASDNGSSPLFRSMEPTTNESRTFPSFADQGINLGLPAEALPTTGREMHFRVTARDRQSGGGAFSMDDMVVTVSAMAGPFSVTSPNTAVTWNGLRTVTWDVAGTDLPPVNAATVDILLSTNGGLSYPIMLASETPNDGAELLEMPQVACKQARIKIQAADNIFFDVSDVDFTLLDTPPTPVVVIETIQVLAESGTESNGVVDPNEIVSVGMRLKNMGTASASNLVATLLSTETVTSLSEPAAYGPLAEGASSEERSFGLYATGACGDTVDLQWALSNGSISLGVVTQAVRLGARRVYKQTVDNPSQIAVPLGSTFGAASPYPSQIVVGETAGVIEDVSVAIHGINHTWAEDLDILLVGPQGQSVILLSDVGAGEGVADLDLVIEQDGAMAPLFDPLTNGIYRPSNIGTNGDDFDYPGPHGDNLDVFAGTIPSGVWSLYVQDDAVGDVGTITGGWSLTFTLSEPVCSSNSLADLSVSTAGPPLVNAGEPASFSIVVSNAGPDTATGVEVNTMLPDGLIDPAPVASVGEWSQAGNQITWLVGAVAPGASALLTLEGGCGGVASLELTSQVSALVSDPVGENDYARTVAAVNQPPVILGLEDAQTMEDVSATLSFTVQDQESPAEMLAVTASAANADLVAPDGIHLTGEGSMRSIQISPKPGSSGSTEISVVVSDGSAASVSRFNLNVSAVDNPPVLMVPGDQVVHQGVQVVVASALFDPDGPSVTPRFSSESALPAGASLDPDTGVLTWRPGPDAVGTTNRIALRVSSSGSSEPLASGEFQISVMAPPTLLGLTISNNTTSVVWTSVPAGRYAVEYTDSLTATNWVELPGVVTADGYEASIEDPVVEGGQRFYRVRVLE